MIVGASLGGFRGLTLSEAMNTYLKLSEKFSLDAVEIRFEKERERPSSWHWEISNELRRFLKNFRVTGVHLPFVYINPVSPNPRIRDESLTQLRESMQKAAELGAAYVVMHLRGISYNGFDGWVEVIEELVSLAERLPILLTLENADTLNDLDLLVNVVSGVNSKWFKVTFDVGHAHIRKVAPLSTYPIKDVLLRALDIFLPLYLTKKNMPYEAYGSIQKFVESNLSLIKVVHVHDYNGKRDHLPIGNGKINFSFMKALKERFEGPYIFEADFLNHEKDFVRNYYAFKRLMEG